MKWTVPALAAWSLPYPASASFAFAPTHLSRPRPPTPSRTKTALFASTSTSTSTSALESLSSVTTLSIDGCCDSDAVKDLVSAGHITDATFGPQDVTDAVTGTGGATYESMAYDSIEYAKERLGGGDASLPNPEEEVDLAMDYLIALMGARLAALVPGRVSTPLDVRVSDDAEASADRARRIVGMYKDLGVPKERMLIRLAGTWGGIQAARALQREGIDCDVHLVTSFLQAAASAQAGAARISPSPGSVLDWHATKTGRTSYHPSADPGVSAVRRMYGYLKKYGHATRCSPSSPWRSSSGGESDAAKVEEVLALAGADSMSLPPPLLEVLSRMDGGSIARELDAEKDAAACCDPDFALTKETWEGYWETDGCGRDKLAEGVEALTKETVGLREVIISRW